MNRRKYWVLLITMLLLLALINYTGDDSNRLGTVKDTLSALMIPVQSFFASLGQNVQSLFDAVFFHHEIKAENEKLKEEFAVYQEQSSLITELQKENYRLKEMLDFREKSPMEMVAARVVSRDPSQWFNTITLNRGSVDGVEQEMAVVSPQGLVGMVSSVSRHSCQAILLTDSRLPASAMVQRSRDPGVMGIIEGYSRDNARLKFTNIPLEANILPGDQIITSGLGGVFPKNIIIGTVEEVDVDQSGLVKMAVVIPAVNFNRIEEVLIIISK
ncbi:MAG: rod shape-determining protein MreC [Firmicutes bacterium]|nr:rod shape-determining protein MreC [Bacillota bacterium]